MCDEQTTYQGTMKTQPNWSRTGWERKLPPVEERSWYTVQETARILLNRGVIHRESSQNKHGLGEITGEQQVRKYIRKKELNGTLFEGSKKYGYIIDKQELERFCKVKKEELKEKYRKYLEKLED